MKVAWGVFQGGSYLRAHGPCLSCHILYIQKTGGSSKATSPPEGPCLYARRNRSPSNVSDPATIVSAPAAEPTSISGADTRLGFRALLLWANAVTTKQSIQIPNNTNTCAARRRIGWLLSKCFSLSPFL